MKFRWIGTHSVIFKPSRSLFESSFSFIYDSIYKCATCVSCCVVSKVTYLRLQICEEQIVCEDIKKA